MKASKLIEQLSQHIQRYGDTPVTTLCGRSLIYQELSEDQTHVGHEGCFIIQTIDYGDEEYD